MKAVPRYWAVVAAAGAGTRMGGAIAKPWLPLAGRSVLEWSLAPLLALGWIDGVMLVVSAEGEKQWRRSALHGHPRLRLVRGGAERADSVRAGLDAVSRLATWPERTWVLVHDAARPCVSTDEIGLLREQATVPEGGLLARPVTDTLKQHEGQRVIATHPRAGMAGAQTPQMFPLTTLRRALAAAAAAQQPVTDEASAIEAAGLQPRLVWGRTSNLKVTYPEDLALAAFWLQHPQPGVSA